MRISLLLIGKVLVLLILLPFQFVHRYSVFALAEHSGPLDDLMIKVDTTKPGSTGLLNYRLETLDGNFDVDCTDDGKIELKNRTVDFQCSYPKSGVYTIRIIDNTGKGEGFTQFIQVKPEKLIMVDLWGKSKWVSFEKAFNGAVYLSITAKNISDMKLVKDMSGMFALAKSFNEAIGGWYTSHVTDMNCMFCETSAFNQRIGDWVTSEVINLNCMFCDASAFNQNIGEWDTSNVENMYSVFGNAVSFNLPIDKRNTYKVNRMNSMV